MKQLQQAACELCGGQAALFCDSDSAFLCWACDASVHAANFLVARHVRRVACAACHSLDDARCISGPVPPRRVVHNLCASCRPAPPSSPSHSADASSSSASSSCLSTSESTPAPPPRAEKPARQRRRGRCREVEGVLLRWAARMGLQNGRRCAEAAAVAIGACRGATLALTLRVALAAALWFGIKLFEGEAAQERGARGATLRQLEACSGVPARLILSTELRIARVAERTCVAEEGWAECSEPISG